MTDSKEIGKILREARQKKGLSVDKVYKQTHIQPNVIEAIEEGRIDEALDRVYALLFLKKYALFLGLDAGSLAAGYKTLHADKEELVLDIKIV